jgi:flagellar hook-associated protein 3 FlgL
MRISTGMIYDAGVRSINRQTASLLHLQQQIATGRRILSPSDDPVAAARALEVTQSVDVVAQFKQNHNNANSALGLEEAQLSSSGDLLARVRELTVQAGNTSLTNSDRRAITAELRARFEELTGIANATDGGGLYIFSGFMGSTKPFGGTVENITSLAAATSTGATNISGGITVVLGVSDTLGISLDGAAAVNLTLTPGLKATGSLAVSDINTKINASTLAGKVLASLDSSGRLVLTTVGTDALGAHKSLVATGNALTLLGAQTSVVGAGSEMIYQGDDGQRRLQVSPTRFLEVSDSGNDVFKRIRNGNGYFVTDYAAGNTGTGVIDTGSVTDPAAWNALPTKNFSVNFSIDNVALPPVTYYDIVDTATGNSKLTGVAPVLPPTALTGQRVYQSGQPIVLSQATAPAFDLGSSVLISGSPANGDSFSIAPSSSQSVFATLANLIGALETSASTPAANAKLSSEIGFALINLDHATDNILGVRTQIGSRMAEVESLSGVNEDLTLQYQQTLSQLQDLDYAKGISDFTRKQTDLQAAQQSFIKSSQLSLFNYL